MSVYPSSDMQLRALFGRPLLGIRRLVSRPPPSQDIALKHLRKIDVNLIREDDMLLEILNRFVLVLLRIIDPLLLIGLRNLLNLCHLVTLGSVCMLGEVAL